LQLLSDQAARINNTIPYREQTAQNIFVFNYTWRLYLLELVAIVVVTEIAGAEIVGLVV
jgi:hypothetical protein